MANVLDEQAQGELLADLVELLEPGGVAYVTVRDDLPLEGSDGQRFVVLPELELVAWEGGAWRMYALRKEVSE